MEDTQTPEMQALDEAIQKAGGVGALATRIGLEYGSTVSNWKARGRVPAEYCPAIERETGVRCERLCRGPDWAFLRLQVGGRAAAKKADAGGRAGRGDAAGERPQARSREKKGRA